MARRRTDNAPDSFTAAPARPHRPRALVIDDDALVRIGVTETLRSRGWAVHAEADGRALDQAMSRFRPDVAVLDVRLAVGPDGYEMARWLRDRSDVPILFLTGASALHERMAGFGAGADDYLTKPFAPEELLARLRAILRRTGAVATQAWTVAGITVDASERTVSGSGNVVRLSPHEFAVLAAMSRRPGRTFTKAELLRLVWNYDGGNPNMVEVRVSSLRHKLERLGPRLIHTVRGGGYTFRPEP